MQRQRYIYIMLSMTGTKFSRFLQLCTGKEYTHVSIAMDRQLGELYSFGRRSMNLPFIAGLVRENPKGGVFAKYHPRCLIYEVPVSEEEYHAIRGLLRSFFRDYERYHYNFVGLPFIALGIPTECRYHFVCSQFVAYLLDKSGAVQWDKDFSLVQPADFIQLENKRQIYQGFLCDYALSA